ncbi:hypothetical protein J6590_013814 [Homalodisca vitripennis]|nr:hypothetical protein J6590_013814 [Homalodisca vitripennis]
MGDPRRILSLQEARLPSHSLVVAFPRECQCSNCSSKAINGLARRKVGEHRTGETDNAVGTEGVRKVDRVKADNDNSRFIVLRNTVRGNNNNGGVKPILYRHGGYQSAASLSALGGR